MTRRAKLIPAHPTQQQSGSAATNSVSKNQMELQIQQRTIDFGTTVSFCPQHPRFLSPNSEVAVAAIEKQMKLASCSCSDHNGKCCLALFTVGEVVDIRLQRKYLGYAEEKALRSIELKRALEMQHATGSNKLRVTVSGKQLCLQGYILVSGVPRGSGSTIVNIFCLSHSFV